MPGEDRDSTRDFDAPDGSVPDSSEDFDTLEFAASVSEDRAVLRATAGRQRWQARSLVLQARGLCREAEQLRDRRHPSDTSPEWVHAASSNGQVRSTWGLVFVDLTPFDDDGSPLAVWPCRFCDVWHVELVQQDGLCLREWHDPDCLHFAALVAEGAASGPDRL